MMDQPASQENRTLAALGYPIWIVALIVLLTDLKQNRFMRVHAIQALGYTAAWVVIYIGLSILTSVPFLGLALLFLWPLLWFAWLVIALIYASRAYQGQMFSIPIVSQFTTRYVGAA
jgi:uncharacterized membrane protein